MHSNLYQFTQKAQESFSSWRAMAHYNGRQWQWIVILWWSEWLQLEDDGNDGRVLAQPGIVVYHGVTLAAPPMFLHVFYIRKSLFCLSLNVLNCSRNSACDFLNFFLTFTEINWLEWLAISLIILYTWIWIPSLIFWMQ